MKKVKRLIVTALVMLSVGCATQPALVEEDSHANETNSSDSNLDSKTISIIGGGVVAIAVNPIIGILAGAGTYYALEDIEK